MRLVDAESLLTDIMMLPHNGDMISSAEVEQAILDAPTIEAEPVVHGRWIFGTANHREYMKCSECLHSQTPTGVFVYCPNCGAKMDGGI